MFEYPKDCNEPSKLDPRISSQGVDTPDDDDPVSIEKIAEKIELKKRSPKAAILAKCHDCMGYYRDGRLDCRNPRCSLYSYMPYRQLEPDHEWCEYNQKKVGKQKITYDAESAQRAREMLAKQKP